MAKDAAVLLGAGEKAGWVGGWVPEGRGVWGAGRLGECRGQGAKGQGFRRCCHATPPPSLPTSALGPRPLPSRARYACRLPLPPAPRGRGGGGAASDHVQHSPFPGPCPAPLPLAPARCPPPAPQITVGLLQRAMSSSSSEAVLIDGFPRNTENRTVWQAMVGRGLGGRG